LLTLWMMACLAAGIDPFTCDLREPVHVTYLDYEMTEDDLLERLESMGFEPAQIHEHLHYYQLPAMPKLDTEAGGARLMQLVERDQSQVVVIDTLSRVVSGEENSNDTYIEFFSFTGRRLKQAGIAMARLDHEGHKAGKSRGASSKADDVDVVWRLEPTETGISLVRKESRLSWIPERFDIIQRDEPNLSFSSGTSSWPAGTKDKAAELDIVGAPLDVSKREATRLLKEANFTVGRPHVLLKAITYRRSRRPGTTLGTTL
jgi:hypothetical protein